MAIDVDRGVESRMHRETGVRVYMYIDKPGYYYNEHEKPLSDDFAASAGFPVEQYAKARYRNEKMAEFNAKLTQQLADAEEAAEKEVIRVKGEYKVLAMAYGSAIVVDGDGIRVTPLPVPQEQAFGLLDALVPTPVHVQKAAKKGAA